MRRRDFITGIAGSAAVWPLLARAQQAPMPVIGFVRNDMAADAMHLVTAFNQGLKEAGFIDRQNVAIEYCWGENHPDRLKALVNDLIGRPRVKVIVGNTIAALTAKAASTTVPIIFTTGSDPVSTGLVGSLNRPEGNVTGVVFFASGLGAKRLDLLRQLVRGTKSIAVLIDPNYPNAERERRDVKAGAQAFGLQLVIVDAASESDIERAFSTFVQRGADALLVGTGAFLNSNRERIVALAARHGLPASYVWREAVAVGGLMSYASSITDANRQAGIYAGRLLKGEKPSDLPVMRSTKFEFALNLKTAKTLGLDIPPTLLALADEVIE
jgi:putative ABC transport system substrate-binding protein